MATNLSALKAAIKLVADAATDSIKAAGDATSAAKLSEYSNLLPDVMALIPQIGDVPVEAKALAEADYSTLLQELVADLALPEGHVKQVIAASLKLLTDIAMVVVPDVEALIAAIKSPAA